MRKPCLQCFRKHMGNAAVLMEEVLDGYPYRFLVCGHLDQAAQEIRRWSPRLATVVRAHRIRLQNADFDYDIPFEEIDRFISDVELMPDHDTNFPEIPESCYEGLERNATGGWELYEGDQR